MTFFASGLKKQNKIMGVRTPTGIDDMLLWVDGSTIEADASDNCYRWRSKTNGYYLDNTASLSTKPTMVQNHINGSSALLFENAQYLEARRDGVNQSLILSASGSYAFTSFIVMDQDSALTSTDGVMGWGIDSAGSDTDGISMLIHNSTDGIRMRIETLSTSISHDSTVSLRDDEYHILTNTYGAQADVWLNRVDGKNDTQKAPTKNDQDAAMDSFCVGRRGSGATYLEGHIAEIMIYDRILTDLEIEAVEDYLFAKYFSPAAYSDVVEWFRADRGVQQ